MDVPRYVQRENVPAWIKERLLHLKQGTRDPFTRNLLQQVVEGLRKAVLLFGARKRRNEGCAFTIVFGGLHDERDAAAWFVYCRSIEHWLSGWCAQAVSISAMTSLPFGFCRIRARVCCGGSGQPVMMLTNEDKAGLTMPPVSNNNKNKRPLLVPVPQDEEEVKRQPRQQPQQQEPSDVYKRLAVTLRTENRPVFVYAPLGWGLWGDYSPLVIGRRRFV